MNRFPDALASPAHDIHDYSNKCSNSCRIYTVDVHPQAPLYGGIVHNVRKDVRSAKRSRLIWKFYLLARFLTLETSKRLLFWERN